MQSNRELFQEMREGESQEIPPQEEPNPTKRKLTVLEMFERRSRAYDAAVFRNRARQIGYDAALREKMRPKSDLSDIETRPLHNHAKPLTAVQKLYHIPTHKSDEKELPTTEDIKASFNTFKQSRGLGKM